MLSRLLTVLAVATTLGACGDRTTPLPPTSPSTTSAGGASPTASPSHNPGRDCTTCHAFYVAGTVYKSDGTTVYPGAVVRLTTGSGGSGTVVATLTADPTGNVYAIAPVDFGSGLYATVNGTGGAVRSMSATITSGACNRCHVSGARIVGS